MSAHRRTIERYIEGFNRTDHAAILDCLTDDVEWLIPGAFHVTGKPAFDAQIEHPDFVQPPTVTITRMVEDGDVVVAEGAVRSRRVDGGTLHAMFCDVFEMRGGKIRKLISYLAVLP